MSKSPPKAKMPPPRRPPKPIGGLVKPARKKAGLSLGGDLKIIHVETLRRPETIPAEYAGGYIAWSPDGLRIEGHGATIAEARASAGGHPGLLIQKVPPLDHLRTGMGAKPGPAEG